MHIDQENREAEAPFYYCNNMYQKEKYEVADHDCSIKFTLFEETENET